MMHTVALLLGLAVGAPAPTTPARIVIIRHAEKPADPQDPHLSATGRDRAKLLVTFLSTDPEVNKFGPPVAVFATHETKDGDGQRTAETVAPYAAAAHLVVQAPVTGKDFGILARKILRDPQYAGKTVIICWNHEFIPQLAAALGVAPAPRKWKSSDFDTVYLITYHGGNAKLRESVEGLSPKP